MLHVRYSSQIKNKFKFFIRRLSELSPVKLHYISIAMFLYSMNSYTILQVIQTHRKELKNLCNNDENGKSVKFYGRQLNNGLLQTQKEFRFTSILVLKYILVLFTLIWSKSPRKYQIFNCMILINIIFWQEITALN